jgi:acyl dehydratase
MTANVDAGTRRKIGTIDDLRALVGEEIGVSSWVLIDQATIDAFAEATDDRQWIHVDPDRAARESTFGSTIAHGFLILALAVPLALDVLEIDVNDAPGGIKFGVNYGLDRVRFISPLPVDSRIRARVEVLSVEEEENGAKFAWRLTFEREGGEKPVAVADWIQRVFT